MSERIYRDAWEYYGWRLWVLHVVAKVLGVVAGVWWTPIGKRPTKWVDVTGHRPRTASSNVTTTYSFGARATPESETP